MEMVRVDENDVLRQISETLQSMRNDYRQLATAVETIEGRVNILTGLQQLHQSTGAARKPMGTPTLDGKSVRKPDSAHFGPVTPGSSSPTLLSLDGTRDAVSDEKAPSLHRGSPSGLSSRIILTTYPGQSGIDPIEMNWGHRDAVRRGPVVVSRSQSTIRRRNGTLIRVIDNLFSVFSSDLTSL